LTWEEEHKTNKKSSPQLFIEELWPPFINVYVVSFSVREK